MTTPDQIPAPAVIQTTPVLRVLGTTVTQNALLKSAAEQDVGVKLDFITLDGTEAQRRCALAPNSFDVYDQWFHDLDLVWPAGSLQGIELERIRHWDEINKLPKTGRLSDLVQSLPGGNPSDRLYVQLDRSLARKESDLISMLPTVHNADGFAVIGERSSSVSSWGDLLSPEWSGKVILQRDAAIGSLEILMALKAQNKLQVANPGNLTLEEIDNLTQLLKAHVDAGQFHSSWADEAQAISALRSGDELIGSLWWSGAAKLRRFGVPVRIIEPREGSRGWFGGMSLSARLSGRALDYAYEYLNWWLGGYAGAVMARQGSYISNPAAAKRYLSNDEWNFWYEGKPAKVPIADNDGQVIYEIGEIRGGSYEDRMNRISIWDTVFEEHNYLVRRWEQALANL